MSQTLRSHADNRADEILDRITGTFAHKGFDGSSMQDLAAAAGMSVGNFYRYYPSKFALIGALVERCARDVRIGFEAARNTADPLEALRIFLQDCLLDISDDEAALWLQIDAAALTYPEIASVKEKMDAGLREDLMAILGSLMPSDDPERLEDLADFLMFCSSGLFQQRAFRGRKAFDAKLQRMTGRLFDAVKGELASKIVSSDQLETVS